MKEPHGGVLVDRTVDEATHRGPLPDADSLAQIQLDEQRYQDAMNLANGRFSPLTGFMNRDDFLKVVHDGTLEDGTIWPLPITLDVGHETAADINPEQRAILVDPRGEEMGTMEVNEVYKYNKSEAAAAVFGTDDLTHPGIENFLAREDFLVGGPINVFEGRRYNSHDLYPIDSRVLFRELGWETVVGFQTRNAPHRGHEYIQKCALEMTDGLFIQPKLGDKKPGDYRDEAILAAYEQLMEHYYPRGKAVLSVFPSPMRYAGPREAVFDAIVRKNHGCSHFIIGRDHAGVGDYYEEDESRRVFEQIGNLGIEPLLFEHAFYCRACDGMSSDKTCPHGEDRRVYPSGSKIRELIRSGERPPEEIMRPEIANLISNLDQPFEED